MSEKLCNSTFETDTQTTLARKLIEADLPLAAKAFGIDLGESEIVAANSATCPEDDFLKRVEKIAAITGDELLAEKVSQKRRFPELNHALDLIAMTVLEIYAERFYSFYQDGQPVFIRTEISDFPEWYNTCQDIASQIFIADELENILVISCFKNQAQKSPLLWKLLKSTIATETIRLGHLYPDRDMARRIFTELMQKLRELLTIREQHESSLQLGEHPEELIPYIWANILKNLLNRNLCDTLDNINALAYLHYAAEKTESITGTAAYTELKKGLLLFSDGQQRTWPHQLRKLFLDQTLVEALLRYRFTHGLVAVNCYLAFLTAEQDGGLQLEPRDEDAIVLNGLLLTQTGFLRSSGIYDPSIREQFLRDACYFRNMRNTTTHQAGGGFFRWREDMKASRILLEDGLERMLHKLEHLQQETQQAISLKQTTVSKLESKPDNNKPTLLEKIFKDTRRESDHEWIESLSIEIKHNEKTLKEIDQIHQHYQKVVHFIKNVSGFFD